MALASPETLTRRSLDPVVGLTRLKTNEYDEHRRTHRRTHSAPRMWKPRARPSERQVGRILCRVPSAVAMRLRTAEARTRNRGRAAQRRTERQPTSMTTESPTTCEAAVRSSDLLADLEGQLQRQKDFVRWLHSVTALPHILGGAQREQAKLEIAVESERRRSANV